MLERLARGGVPIDILLARHKRYREGVPNWTIHRLPIGRGLRWPVAAVLLPPIIKRVHDRTGFDLLRVHSLRYIGPAALAARWWWRLDVPIVAHHHHLDPGMLNRLVEGPVMRGVERVVVGSEFSRGQATRELGVPPEKLAVAYYGVDAKFRPAPPPEELRARHDLRGRQVVLFLGGLKARKNLPFLLEVFGEVVRARPDARLVLAGAGPLAATLQARARGLGVAGQVVFTGYVPEREKVAYYNLADVLLFPSFMEGFGFTVAEAMSCALPVVVSDRGSLPELVRDGEGGFLRDPADRTGFAAAVLRLLADAPLRRAFGEANRARVDRLFRWDACAAATVRIYEETLRAWRDRPRHTAAAHA